MKSELIKFPGLSFRKIISAKAAPGDQLVSDEGEGVNIYICAMDIKNLPGEFWDWRKINPREPNPNSHVSKAIKRTLEEDPNGFILRNRGLTILVEKASFDNQSNTVSLELSDPNLHGLLDGGHTYQIVRDFVDNLPEVDRSKFPALIKMEIIEGVKDLDNVVNIVDARNTSTQVKRQSLEDLKGSFEKIKEVLADTPYLKNISFKETEYDEDGDKKTIDIRDILSYLICFDEESYREDNHPTFAYSQKGGVVEYFSNHKKELEKYIELLPIILELHDTIYIRLPDAYNRKTKGKFGLLTGVTPVKKETNMVELPFIAASSEYKIPSGFVYPILAAFRSVVKIEDERAIWKTDALKLLSDLIEDLAQRVGKQSIQFRNPNALGKDQATWSLCYDLVRLALLQRNIR